MDSNTVIGDIFKLPYKFVYGTANVAGKTKEKGKLGRKKCNLQEEKDIADDPVYELEGSEQDRDDDDGDNNPEGGDDASEFPQVVEVPKYTFLVVHFNFIASCSCIMLVFKYTPIFQQHRRSKLTLQFVQFQYIQDLEQPQMMPYMIPRCQNITTTWA